MKRARMRWLIRKARMPIPAFNIHLGSGPAHGYEGQTYYQALGQGNPQQDILYWIGPLRSSADVFDFYHECGHAFDNHYLTNEDRARATTLLTAHPRAWWWDRSPFHVTARPDPCCELFADSFADMCRSQRRRPLLRQLCMNAYRARGGVKT